MSQRTHCSGSPRWDARARGSNYQNRSRRSSHGTGTAMSTQGSTLEKVEPRDAGTDSPRRSGRRGRLATRPSLGRQGRRGRHADSGGLMRWRSGTSDPFQSRSSLDPINRVAHRTGGRSRGASGGTSWPGRRPSRGSRDAVRSGGACGRDSAGSSDPGQRWSVGSAAAARRN